MSADSCTQAVAVSGVYAKIYGEILADRTLLPTMPDVAVRLRAAMSDPNYDVARVARIVQSDAGAAAYLVRMANSSLFQRSTPSRDVPSAVVRLGMQLTRNIVTAHALRTMFRIRTPVLVDVMKDVWQGSARLAALCAVLAKRCGAFAPDRALLAGLLQDIGALPILNALERRRESHERYRVHATVEALSSKIGATLLAHWGFDDELVTVARTRDDWFRDAGTRADLADLVLVARLHAHLAARRVTDCPRLDQVPAFHKLPCGPLAPDESLSVLAEAESEVRDVAALLGI